MVGRFGPGVTVQEYEVRRETHAAVAESIQRERAKFPEGHTAYTNWSVEEHLVVDEDGHANFTAGFSAVVRLPRLTGGTAAEQECFARFRTNLEAHEEIHVENGRAVARDVAALVAQVGSQDEFNAARVVREAAGHQGDRDLDEETGNGGRDCRWPPPGCQHIQSKRSSNRLPRRRRLRGRKG